MEGVQCKAIDSQPKSRVELEDNSNQTQPQPSGMPFPAPSFTNVFLIDIDSYAGSKWDDLLSWNL